MRFISHITKYQIVAVHQGYEVLANGQGRETSPGFMVEFSPHDVIDAEREQIRRTFQHRGTPTDEGGHPLDPISDQHRVSSFDTGTIPDAALRERVEKALLANSALGRHYVVAEAVMVEAPVANWLKLTTVQGQRTVEKCAEKAVALVEELGLDVELVVAFERQEDRKESAAIIVAVEAATVKESDAAELVSA